MFNRRLPLYYYKNSAIIKKEGFIMNEIMEYLPFLIPLVIIQLALAIAALIHVLKHPDYKFGSKPLWIVIVLLVQIIGPVVYFAFGRRNDE